MQPVDPPRAPRIRRSGAWLALALWLSAFVAGVGHADSFQRIATFPVFLNSEERARSIAEILAATPDGKTLVYSDAVLEALGFVDISDPARPEPAGIFELPGPPTSVAVAGPHAIAVVDTSESAARPGGRMVVVDHATRVVLASRSIGGQPDSIAVSPDGRYAVIAVENQRDEEVRNGALPQAPAGFVAIVDMVGAPSEWPMRRVELTGLAGRFPEDPEPEFVDVSTAGVAAVTLQENNHVVLIDLESGAVLQHWSAGEAQVQGVDVEENRRIDLSGNAGARLREPDAIAWLGTDRLATADEGDLEGGSRGFTLFDTRGRITFASGASLERLASRIGHFPEGRASNKGSEPETVEVGLFGTTRYLFVGAERASFVAVYRMDGERPVYLQALPTGVGPEGILAIPARKLLAVASEVDARKGGIRSTVTLYALRPGPPTYPTLIARDRPDGTPIPWNSLSALAADREDPGRAYAVPDGFLDETRILVLDLRQRPVEIVAEIPIRTAEGESVNLDAEGLSTRFGGGFWVTNEGMESWQLARLDGEGVIQETIRVPSHLVTDDHNSGLEGVAAVGRGKDEQVYVAFQRPWAGDPERHTRIGRYTPATGEWRFFYYLLDALGLSEVGLSELVPLPGQPEAFAVIERDDLAGPAARLKRIRRFSVAGVEPKAEAPLPVLEKSDVLDLIPVFRERGGPVLQKPEGLMVTKDGRTWLVTDNDGANGTSGETQLIDLGELL